MQSSMVLRATCVAGRHKLDDFGNFFQHGKPACKGCAQEFGKQYDYEWTNHDIEALLGDFREALSCQCGGPSCGPNARKVYASAYPALGQLFR